MELKIFNNISNAGQIYDTISNGLFDFAPPEKFKETLQIDECNIILMSGAISSQGTLSINLSAEQVTLGNSGEVAKVYEALSEKHRIVWLDTMGPNINRNPDIFLEKFTGLRDTDILISPASVPQRPNLFTNAWHVEKSLFCEQKRFQRVPGSVMMSRDNLLPEVNVIKEVMPVVSELHVTKYHVLGDEIEDSLQKHLNKISCEMLPYPKGIVYKASQCEFVLHTHTTLGVEMMGIEAGMAGCQPIYPDTEFYRDIFDGTGVAFYNTQNAVDSLRSIIEGGSTFTDKQIEAFRTKFSAEDNLPAFWAHVYDLYTAKSS